MRFRPALAGALAALAVVALAADAPAQNVAFTYVMTPRPGADAALDAALRTHSQWRQENGDPWSWDLWQVAYGASTGAVHARSSGHSWADLDAYNASPFAARAGSHFNATVLPHLASAVGQIDEMNADLSMPPAPGSTVAMVEATAYHVEPDRMGAFMEVVRRFREAASAQGWTAPYVVTVSRTGPGPVVSIVGLCPDWACMAGPGMTPEEVLRRAYGDEEADRLLTQFAGAYTHYETSMLMRRPDLSVQGGM